MSEAIQRQQITPKELLDYYLNNIEKLEKEVSAWAYFDQSLAIKLAEEYTVEASEKRIRGPLHGIPIGVKDNMDVKGMPTRVGSRVWDNREGADRNSSIIDFLQELGAIVVGKTHMTEYAWLDPAPTKNPRNLHHTPGGSSSGSAASVAAEMIPLALGTQTAASVCRPGAYCGVVAFKPTKMEPFTDAVPLSPTFDTIGFFVKSLDDLLFLKDYLPLGELQTLPKADVQTYKIGIIEDPLYETAQDEVKSVFEVAKGELEEAGCEIIKVYPKVSFTQLIEWHRTVIAYEAAQEYYEFVNKNQNSLSKNFKDLVFEGHEISEEKYLATLSLINRSKEEFWKTNNVDCFISMPADTTAPKDLQTTGSPFFTTPWTVLGGPLLTIPYGSADNNLPISIMFATKPHTDKKLIEVTNLLLNEMKKVGK